MVVASSARVLNLHALAAKPPDEPGYGDRPMFLHPVLNRTIIMKHNVRSPKEDRFAPRRFGVTKVIFPFDPTNLSLGGQYVFVDQPDFVDAIRRRIDREDGLDRDLTVLRVLDRLPTLDPFLVKGALNVHRIQVADCYYRLTDADRQEMLGFVASEIETLIRLCFRNLDDVEERSHRLSHLLLEGEEGSELALLRESMRMESFEFADAIFAWKAFLYYRWRSRSLAPQIRATERAIRRVAGRRFEARAQTFVGEVCSLLEQTITQLLQEAAARIARYDSGFRGLTERGDTESFRKALLGGAGLYLELGERIGRLEQIVTFWAERFGEQPESAVVEDTLDALRDLLQGLSLWRDSAI